MAPTIAVPTGARNSVSSLSMPAARTRPPPMSAPRMPDADGVETPTAIVLHDPRAMPPARKPTTIQANRSMAFDHAPGPARGGHACLESAEMDPARPTSGWPLLRRVLHEQRRGLIAGMVVGLLWSAGKVTVPRLTRLAVDKGVIGRDSLWFWSGLIIAVAVIAGVFSGWRRWIAFRESRLTETRTSEQLFAHIMKLHVGYHDHTRRRVS